MFHRFKWTPVSRRRNAITEEYEPLQPYFLLAAMEQMGCKSFIDVGANIGVYSIFASQLDTITTIIAFEANDDVAGELATNMALNAIKGEVRRQAVSDKPGKIEFGIVSKFAGNSGVVDTSREAIDYSRRTSVEAVVLDTALADVPFPMALKVDVEGHEAQVLSGAEALLSQGTTIIQIEDYDRALSVRLEAIGYHLLTRIGPDHYFTNDPSLDAKALFEDAARRLIESNHENKRVTLRRAGLGLELSGTPYKIVKKVAEKLMGSKL